MRSRPWTVEEDQYVRENYWSMRAPMIGKEINRSAIAVRKRARVLGVESELKASAASWKEEELQFLRENYQEKGLVFCMQKLKRSRHSVNHKATTLGLTKETRRWTDWELNYIEKKYTSQPATVTAKRLNRSVASVQHKAIALGVNSYVSELYSAQSIASCFNYSGAVVTRWVKNHGLPAKKVGLDSFRYMIDPEDFWKWAEEHKCLINWSKYIPYSLPPEPDWLNETRKGYRTTRTRKPVTAVDKSQIMHMRRQRKTYQEIADSIGRTRSGVIGICRRMAAN